MAAVVETFCIENELAAIRIQEAELQAQQDALLAERMAIAFSLDVDTEDEKALENALLQFGLDAPGVGDILQLESQLAELRATEDHLCALSLQESLSDQEHAARESAAMAAALQAMERWNAQVVRHDAAFARKLASVDENDGDQLQEPLDLPMPGGGPAAQADAAGPFNASASATSEPTPAQIPSQSPTPTPPPASLALRQTTRALPGATGPGFAVAGQASRLSGASSSSAGADPSAASGAGPSAQRPAGPSRGTIECLSCFDTFPEGEVICAGADAASSSSAAAGCGHYFCQGCLTAYVRGAVKDRKFPIACPMAAAGGRQQQQQQQRQQRGCQLKFSRGSVLAALAGYPKDQQSFGQLEAESSLDPGQLLYCPHKGCSSPLLLDDVGLPPDQPVICPACRKGFCPRCRIAGWHKGYTCAAFQALPAHLRSAEDAAVLQLSAQQQWKHCPQCKQMVERASGCNHMLCRCGANFCYACGKPYKDTKPTPGNVHGTPACGCQLFDVPEEPGDRGGAAADQPARGGPVRAPPQQPFRGGRLVRRTRCRHSASIYDCPQGPNRCWFWHDEDDGEHGYYSDSDEE